MISASEKNEDAEEMNSIGRDFASRYYDAFMGKPDPSAFRRFFDANSKYSFVQRCGRPDHDIQGADMIAKLVERMQYNRCAVTVRSVETTRVGPTRFKVSAIGELLRPENDVPRKFVQSTIIRRVAWTQGEFLVVDTVFEFDDKIVDDVLPKAEGENSIFDPMPVVKRRDNANVGGKSSPAATAVDGRRIELSSPRTGNSKRHYVRSMDIFNSNAIKKPAPKETSATLKSVPPKDESNTVKNPTTDPQQPSDVSKRQSAKMGGNKNVASHESVPKKLVTSRKDEKLRTPAVNGSQMTCVRKAKKAVKDPMSDCVPSYIGTLRVSNVKQKADIKKPIAMDSHLKISIPRTDDVCNEMVSTKVILSEKPLAKTPPAIVKAAPKVKANKTPSNSEKAGMVVDKMPKGSQSKKPMKPSISNVNNTKTFVSTNRFGWLTVDNDDFDSRSSENSESLFENTPKFTGHKKKSQHKKLRKSPPTLAGLKNVNTTTVPIKNEMTMAPVDSPQEDSSDKEVEVVVKEEGVVVIGEEAAVIVDEGTSLTVDEEAVEVNEEEVDVVVEEEVVVVVEEGAAMVIDEGTAIIVEEAAVIVDEGTALAVDEEVDVIVEEEAAMIVEEEAAVIVDEGTALVVDEEAVEVVEEEVVVVVEEEAAMVVDEETATTIEEEAAVVVDEGTAMIVEDAAVIVDEEMSVIIDEKAAVIVGEDTAEPSECEKCPSITNNLYIRRIGKIYGRAFIKEAINQLCYINLLGWW